MLYVCLTFDWEGEHFYNLKDFKKILDALDVNQPVTHFICPAYFTNKIQYAKKNIQSLLHSTDEVGLHLHCYKSLVNEAGIKFRSSPNYYNQHLFITKLRDIIFSVFPDNIKEAILHRIVSGRGVPLSAYNYNEILQLIKSGREMLSSNLNVDVVSFRAGGWIANNDVYRALHSLGFLIDTSAVPPEVVAKQTPFYSKKLTDDYGETYPVFSDFVHALWSERLIPEGHLSNSYRLKYFKEKLTKDSFVFTLDNLTEVVNNFGMSDFVTFKATIQPWLESTLTDLTKDYILTYGCHQEGDMFYKKPVLELVSYLKDKYPEDHRFVTMRQVRDLLAKGKITLH